MGTRVLTVEDDERIRASVRLALEDEGWIVDEAATGEEALEIFRRVQSDVVLIDIMLPGIDGFELCRNIRRISDVPVIMVTARVDTSTLSPDSKLAPTTTSPNRLRRKNSPPAFARCCAACALLRQGILGWFSATLKLSPTRARCF